MIDTISAFFLLLPGLSGVGAAFTAAVALVLVLLSVFLFIKLRSAQEEIQRLGERISNESSDSDRTGTLHEDLLRDKEEEIKLLAQRIADLEAERERKAAAQAAFQKRAKDLEDQLKLASTRNNEVEAKVRQQVEAKTSAMDMMELRILNLEAEKNDALKALEKHTQEFEDQLQQASARNDEITSQTAEVAEARRIALEQMEERFRGVEAENNARLTALQKRSKELEDRLHQISHQNTEIAGLTDEQLKAHHITVERLEQQIRNAKAENEVHLIAAQQRARELEDKLQQASGRNKEIEEQAAEQTQNHRADIKQMQQRSKELEEKLRQATKRNSEIEIQAAEQAQTHRTTVEQLELRMRSQEAENNASHLQAKELEEQLQQSSIRNNEMMAQASKQAKAHRATVEQLQQRILDMEATGGTAGLFELQQRTKELEDQLQRATILNNEVMAQTNEQAKTHRATVEQLEKRIQSMDATGGAGLIALQEHAKELEERLQKASSRNREIEAESSEQDKAHRTAVKQMQQRIRDIEDEGSASVRALQQRSREMEEQLQQASGRNKEIAAESSEQDKAHRAAVKQMQQRIRDIEDESGASVKALQQRIRDIEAESSASLSAHQQRAKELEGQLQQALLRKENEESSSHEEMLEQNANMERLQQRIRDLESETDGRESRVTNLQEQVKDLEELLRQASERVPADSGKPAPDSSKHFLLRAEGILGSAVGPVRLLGLVAAEVYTAAAVAADPRDNEARQLLAELIKLRSGSRGLLPSVAESVTTFDEKAAAFLESDPAGAADFAEKEALERHKSGQDRSALLVTNFGLALRQQSGPFDLAGTDRLHEIKTMLLARLGAL